MTTAAINEVYQVRIHYRLEEQEVLNVLHFKALAPDSDVLVHLLRVVVQCVVTTLLPGLANQIRLEKVTGMRVSPDVGPELEAIPDPTGTIQGMTTGDSLPSYCSALISIKTERGGRSGRGRMFIAGIPESGTVGSKLSPEVQPWLALIAFVGCIASHFGNTATPGPGDWVFGVVSRKLGNPKPPYLLPQFAPVMSMNPVSLLATTRSRKVGKGS